MIIGAGTPGDRSRLPLSTKDRWEVPNEQRKEDAPARLQAARELWARERPNAKLRALSATYNCVGLVFGNRRTCIDSDHLTRILEGDGYRRLDTPSDIAIGDVVIYRTAEGIARHVGLIVGREPIVEQGSVQITVLSQWGYDGEYLHDLNDVPELYGNLSEFWTERKGES